MPLQSCLTHPPSSNHCGLFLPERGPRLPSRPPPLPLPDRSPRNGWPFDPKAGTLTQRQAPQGSRATGLKPTSTVISSLVVAMQLCRAASLQPALQESWPVLQGTLLSRRQSSLERSEVFNLVGYLLITVMCQALSKLQRYKRYGS